DPVPYFWSDQFGRKVQYVGHHDPADDVEIDTSDPDKPAARWHSPAGRPTAWLGVNRMKELAGARKAIAQASA
ncbi:hypothetical protein ACZ91_27305, partial [Streptomyces regensis]